jgi:hypothetical protein
MTLQERFEQFHQANPHIYDMLVELSRKMKAKKTMRQWSVYAAYELVRYQWNNRTRSFDDYKLPNEFRPIYSRLIMEQEPDLDGFFRIKGSQSLADEHKMPLLELFEMMGADAEENVGNFL